MGKIGTLTFALCLIGAFLSLGYIMLVDISGVAMDIAYWCNVIAFLILTTYIAYESINSNHISNDRTAKAVVEQVHHDETNTRKRA